MDLGDGQVVALGHVNEYDPEVVGRWLDGLMKQLGANVNVTDDLHTYRSVSENLNLGHQVCQFHVHRWVGNTLKELRQTLPKAWQWVLEEINQLIEVLPPQGHKRLYALWKQIKVRRSGTGKPLSALDQLRALLLRLNQNWQGYCTFQYEAQIP